MIAPNARFSTSVTPNWRVKPTAAIASTDEVTRPNPMEARKRLTRPPPPDGCQPVPAPPASPAKPGPESERPATGLLGSHPAKTLRVFAGTPEKPRRPGCPRRRSRRPAANPGCLPRRPAHQTARIAALRRGGGAPEAESAPHYRAP